MNALQYSMFAIGFVMIAFNIQINGIQLIFPRCLGYALIGIGAWGLRDEDGLFKYAMPIAVIMAVLAFPELFDGAMAVASQLDQPSPFYQWNLWTFFPYTILHIVLCVLVSVAIARQANKWNKPLVLRLAITAALLAVAFEALRFADAIFGPSVVRGVLCYDNGLPTVAGFRLGPCGKKISLTHMVPVVTSAVTIWDESSSLVRQAMV